MKIQHIDNHSSAAGIIGFEVSEISPRMSGATISFSIPTAGVGETQLGYVGEEPIRVNVHTNSLKPGTHEITISVGDTKAPLHNAKCAFEIKRTSPLGERVREQLSRARTPVAFMGPCDSSFYPYASTDAIAWFDRPDAGAHVDRLLARCQISQAEARWLRQFVTDGYMTVENLIDEDLIRRVNQEIDQAISIGYQGYKMGSSQRIEHLHLHYPNMKKLWLDHRHLRLANLIFDEVARPCQTLTYVFGSQQDEHQDTIHLTPFPAGYLCGTWVALQDIMPDSGELIVYPGSHREPRIYLKETGCPKMKSDWSEFGKKVVPRWKEIAQRYQPVTCRPKKGTVLIWHENLLHAGSARMNKSLERRSVVIHCFADGAIGYYDSTGMRGFAVDPSTTPNQSRA